MSMEKIGSADLYRSGFYEKPAQAKRETESAKVKGADTAQKQVSLSRDAQKLLKELKKSYGNMDFIVADYKTDEEAASYLSRGTNEYSVLISPEELEKMAADKDVKEKNLKTLDKKEAAAEEAKKAEAKKAEEGTGRIPARHPSKHTTVFAGTVEELAEKIGQVDWSTIKEDAPANGQKFDFTI